MMKTNQSRNKFDINYNHFTVKHCTSCNYCWEKEGSKQVMYYDFPKYGLEHKNCNNCKKRELSNAQV